MNKSLPERPDLDQLKKQAKALLNAIKARSPEALARIGKEDPDAFALNDAQRVLAREYGYQSWPRLKLFVETRTEEQAAARFVWALANGEAKVVAIMLKERPALASRDIWTVAALANENELAGLLAKNPALATTQGGPCQAEPLAYVCIGQLGGDDAARAACAKLLLAQGGDANATWFDKDWPDERLPALFAATGRGNFPKLARVMLAAGAKAEDGESIYHAAEKNHRESLQAMADAGANFSDRQRPYGNTPLYFLLGYAPHSAAAPVAAEGIRWLVEHGANPNVPSYIEKHNETALHAAVKNGWPLGMIELFLQHGADANARRQDGRTPYVLAVRAGRADVVEKLLLAGARDEATAVDRFLGACLQADEKTARAIAAAGDVRAAALPVEDHRVVLDAARLGNVPALRTMQALGFDLAITAETGETALHLAAWQGWVEAVKALLAAKVPLEVLDQSYQAPPFNWCCHGSQFCKNPRGDYAATAEAMLRAGVVVQKDITASHEVMAIIRRMKTN